MVRLREIKKNGDKIICAAFVEDCKDPIRLEYDISDGSIQYDVLPKGYEHCTSHVGHARRSLERMVKAGKLEPQVTIMWY